MPQIKVLESILMPITRKSNVTARNDHRAISIPTHASEAMIRMPAKIAQANRKQPSCKETIELGGGEGTIEIDVYM